MREEQLLERPERPSSDDDVIRAAAEVVARDGGAIGDDVTVNDDDFPAMANISSLVSFVNGTCLSEESVGNGKERHRSGRSIGNVDDYHIIQLAYYRFAIETMLNNPHHGEAPEDSRSTRRRYSSTTSSSAVFLKEGSEVRERFWGNMHDPFFLTFRNDTTFMNWRIHHFITDSSGSRAGRVGTNGLGLVGERRQR